jgi:hypothetical protein
MWFCNRDTVLNAGVGCPVLMMSLYLEMLIKHEDMVDMAVCVNLAEPHHQPMADH